MVRPKKEFELSQISSTYACMMFVAYERKLAGETKYRYKVRIRKKYRKKTGIPNLQVIVIGWRGKQ